MKSSGEAYLCGMDIRPHITQVFIKWEVDGQQVLMIYLSRSGAINRLGDGQAEPEVTQLCMGRVAEPWLEEWLGQLDPAWLEQAGRYTMPDPKGKMCTLAIALEGEDLDTGFAFTYGSESMGPPEEMVQLVDVALELTDEWYEDQLPKKQRK
ncbi:MAG: hypothetical protein AAF399_29650 [Bacteroidota bacterium]